MLHIINYVFVWRILKRRIIIELSMESNVVVSYIQLRTRKIHSSNNSFIITIPIEFMRSQKFTKGDSLDAYTDGKKLILLKTGEKL